MAEPVKGVAYEFSIGLDSVVDSGFQVDPIIVDGDFTISKDFGAFVNLMDLPGVDPPGSTNVRVQLTALEMDADKITIFAKDQEGDEWDESRIFIDVPAGNSESVLDIIEGDITESSSQIIIKRKGTAEELLNKDIAGSLLPSSVTVTTTEP